MNVKDLINEENRIIDVSWISEKQASYNVDIEISANDRNGLLADVIKELGNINAKMIGVNARATKERIAIIDLTVEIQNLDELNNIIKALRKIDSVYEVKRKKKGKEQN